MAVGGTIRLEKRAGGIAIAAVDNPPVNALNSVLRTKFADLVDAVDADPEIRALIITGANGRYVAGGDIREFGRPNTGTPLRDVLNRFERGSKPVVCAINGAALGGGLELALGCHWRVAQPDSVFSLPEVSLGMFPGGGGSRRPVRLMGLEAALDLMIGAETINAVKALDLGLIDEIAGDVMAAALAAAERLLQPGAVLRRAGTMPVRSKGEPAAMMQEARARAARRWRGYRAAGEMLDSVERNMRDSLEVAGEADRQRLAEIFVDPQTVALRHLFLAERAALKVPGVGRDVKPRAIASVGIIGAGTMGLGIAAACLAAGLPVRITDQSQAARDSTPARLDALLKGRNAAVLTVCANLEEAAQADLVIEAAFETMAVKEPVFRALDAACRPGTILATNTSGLDVDAMAGFTRRPQDVVGLHFFAPAQVMKLLEVVRGEATAPDVLATSLWLAKRLGKIAVTVGNCPMFAANRTRAFMQREVNAIVEEGASPQQIDGALVDFGLAMGFLRVGDLSGLDIGYAARKENPVYSSPGFRRPALADRIVEAGRLGQKTGKGWYLYRDGRTAEDDPEVAEIAARYRAEMGITPRRFSDAEIVQRGLYAAINEGANLLHSGKVSRASDLDVMWCAGFGFPRWRGGPMHHADVTGLASIVAAIDGYSATLGPHWAVSPLLRELAASGSTFAQWDAARA
jgi:3-hydroxyacyl-CoA dehydrogenase